jgi:ubiquinone/menaquinone biosynthesis C-methylase UbiE
LLVPYNEVDRAESHKYTFKEDSFPEIIDDFFKAYSKVIECKDSRYWSGSQLIVIYARKSKELVSDLLEFKEEFKETNYFDSTSVELWDNVSNTYIEEASPSELSLAQEIEQLLIDLGIDKESSLLEVGCGSGHLSGYLAAKGYKTTLMDFSNKALEKAKKYYDHKYIQGEFVQGDLMELSIEAIRQHDVVWNSGVLEHFNSIQALNALKRMRGVAKKYVIILIPNAKSIPYLSWRKYAMENGSWVWGKEYLRESMELLISAAGLEIVEERYIGRNFVKDQLEFVNSDVCKIYLSAYMHNVLPENQDYLVALVARPVEGLDSIIHNKTKELLKEEAEASDRTYNFDNSALLRRTTFLQKKGEEFIASYESVQKMLVNTTDALRAEVESRSIKEKELDNTITALQSDIEARIQNEYDLSAQIRYDRERIAKIENSVTWKLLTRYQQVIDICLPYGTVRRRGYDKCLSIVRGIFIKLV